MGREFEHAGLAMMRKFVEPDDIALVLERLYVDKSFRREQAHKAYQTARRDSYRWDHIAAQWDRLFQQTLVKAPKIGRISDPKNAHR